MDNLYNLPKVQKPFYNKGLKFECQKDCSACCGGSPGYVWLEDTDIDAISKFLKIDRQDFLDEYTKESDGRISLIDLEEKEWDCVMLKDGKCTIYEHRPIQCRTYPFWYQNIYSKKYWEEEQDHCPGIGCGRTYSKDEIEAIADGTETIDSIK